MLFLVVFSRRKASTSLSPEEALAAHYERINAVKHLPIREAERALGVRGYS